MTDPAPRWALALACGHQVTTQGRPAGGSWITCPDPWCQSQQRVVSVTVLSPVLVQGELSGRKELAA